MDTNLFSQINTAIAVKDSSLITAEQFSKMIQANSKEELAGLLQTTPYPLSVEELEDLDAIDRTLMAELARDYAWAYAESPEKSIVSLFALRYLYHNIKVLFKARATGQDLSNLLIDIGPQPLEALRYLVTALDSEFFAPYMIQELREIWAEYDDYKDIRVLEIGADLAYFKDLKKIAEQLEPDTFSQSVTMTIDFYNIITVQRALKQGKPRSFMLQLLSDEGSLSANACINLVENKELISWFNQANPANFDSSLLVYEDKMRQGTISTVELEYLSDLMQHQLYDQARYDVQGPLVLARYLLGREFEVKNLRLLLSAISNQLPMDLVKERMRPIYGQ